MRGGTWNSGSGQGTPQHQKNLNKTQIIPSHQRYSSAKLSAKEVKEKFLDKTLGAVATSSSSGTAFSGNATGNARMESPTTKAEQEYRSFIEKQRRIMKQIGTLKEERKKCRTGVGSERISPARCTGASRSSARTRTGNTRRKQDAYEFNNIKKDLETVAKINNENSRPVCTNEEE